MIFLDTSAVFALADRDDAMHDQAVRMMEASQDANEELLMHSYVLLESAALLQRRLGLKTALAFLKDAEQFHIVWVTGELHAEAVRYLRRHGRSKLSLVDAVSFVVARGEGISDYIGFVEHFDHAGLKRYLA